MPEHDEMSYKELATIVFPSTEGITPSQLVPKCRLGVREVCHDTNILNELQEYEWAEDGLYVLSHSGYDFDEIMGLYVDHPDQIEGRLDPEFTRNTREDIGRTTMIFPSPEEWHPVLRDSKIFIRFSYVPSVDSEGFPKQIYRSSQKLVEVAVKKNVDAFIRRGNRDVSYGASYEREYKTLVREIKARNSQGGFGSRRQRSIFNDSSSQNVRRLRRDLFF